MDFYASIGDSVLACRDGVVVVVEDRGDEGYGKFIVLRHADGWVTWYAHLSDISLVEKDDVVERGAVIGFSGNSGSSTGPHLHLTVQHLDYGNTGYWLRDVVDPLPLLG